jgi:hypothetical protein
MPPTDHNGRKGPDGKFGSSDTEADGPKLVDPTRGDDATLPPAGRDSRRVTGPQIVERASADARTMMAQLPDSDATQKKAAVVPSEPVRETPREARPQSPRTPASPRNPPAPATPSSSPIVRSRIAADTTANLESRPVAASPSGRQVVPTLMQQVPSQQALRASIASAVPPASASASRWIFGPLLAIVMAALTVFVTGKLLPKPPPKPAVVMGRIRLVTEPIAAKLTVDGVLRPDVTPVVIDGVVGTTSKVQLTFDGYQPYESVLAFQAGEKPLSIKLQKLEPIEPPPIPDATPTPPPPPIAVEPPRRKNAKPPKHPPAHPQHKDTAVAAIEESQPVGTGTLSIFVRPWAIVFVDGNRIRQTPIQAFQLTAGKHTIELVNDGRHRHEKLSVTVRPGQAQDIKRNWEAP